MAKQLRNLQKEAQKRYIDATTYTYTETKGKIDKLLINRTYLFVYI